MQIKFTQEYNGIALQLRFDALDSDPESERLREFIMQHHDSDLVLIPAGHCHDEQGEADFWVIRKKAVPNSQGPVPGWGEPLDPAHGIHQMPRERTFVKCVQIGAGVIYAIAGSALGFSAIHFTTLDLRATAILTGSVSWWIGIESLWRGLHR